MFYEDRAALVKTLPSGAALETDEHPSRYAPTIGYVGLFALGGGSFAAWRGSPHRAPARLLAQDPPAVPSPLLGPGVVLALAGMLGALAQTVGRRRPLGRPGRRPGRRRAGRLGRGPVPAPGPAEPSDQQPQQGSGGRRRCHDHEERRAQQQRDAATATPATRASRTRSSPVGTVCTAASAASSATGSRAETRAISGRSSTVRAPTDRPA